MNILCLGDLHYKVGNVRETAQFETELENYLEASEPPDLIVILGDVLDRFSDVHTSPLCRVLKLFDALTRYSKLVILMGNHDRPNQTDFLSDIHPFTSLVLFKHSDITIVDKVTVLGTMLFIPYVQTGRLSDALNTQVMLADDESMKVSDNTALDYLSRGLVSVAFAHQELRGAKFSEFKITSKSSDIWDESWPLLVCGHMHDYHRYGNILYTGSSIFVHHGEAADKSISLLTLSGSEIIEDRIRLMLLRKITIERTAKSLEEDPIIDAPEDNFEVRIIINCTDIEMATLRRKGIIGCLKKLGYTVSVRAKTIIPSNTHTKYTSNKVSFVDRVMEELKDDRELVDVLTDILRENS